MTQYGWFFAAADLRIRHPLADGSRPAIAAGETQHEARPLKLCRTGLHGSVRLIDALQYADSGMLSLCEYGGVIVRGTNKLCAATRTPLAIADIGTFLHEWACDVAEAAVMAYCHPPDPRSLNAIAVKRRWIAGEATDGELDAAGAAPWDTAWGAAGDTAWAAARVAAWGAVRAAVRAAVRGAAWDAQNADLTARVLALPEFVPFQSQIEGAA